MDRFLIMCSLMCTPNQERRKDLPRRQTQSHGPCWAVNSRFFEVGLRGWPRDWFQIGYEWIVEQLDILTRIVLPFANYPDIYKPPGMMPSFTNEDETGWAQRTPAEVALFIGEFVGMELLAFVNRESVMFWEPSQRIPPSREVHSLTWWHRVIGFKVFCGQRLWK